MKMYVSNLSFQVQDEELKKLFEPFGEVNSAKIICDRTTGFSRGFGFVEMNSEEQANNAMSTLQSQVVDGRAMSVSPAREKEQRSPRNTW